MSKKKPHKKKKPKYTSLKLNDRIAIQSGLDYGMSARAIAEKIGRSASTVLREIKTYSHFVPHKYNDCEYRRTCKAKHTCGDYECNSPCHFCSQCAFHCNRYKPIRCNIRFDNYYGLCNGCHRWGNCTLDKYRYEAEYADNHSKEIKREARSGFDLTTEELIAIDDLVSPLVKKGLSIYAIKSQLGNSIPVSESTLRRLIDNSELEARNIDLRTAVKIKPRTEHRRRMKSEIITKLKIGHLYSDYLNFIKNNDCMVCQMDCVEGLKTDNKVLLTLHFPILHFQLAFIMNNHTSACVVDTMDLLEETLGQELYNRIFGVILTDNGHEFLNIEGMERSVFGGNRSRIFFCEPNRSDEKPHCECNHKLIRYILPKKTSFENLVQPDICLMMSHINSYPRESLCGQTPFKVAQKVFPAEFFDSLGIDEIDFNNLDLTPSLLK
ncbi:MAG: IS30 family transposase [Lachnospiraceae bacterium]|nr:IS30 family transposase [Lachnospiraceae bacterium]